MTQIVVKYDGVDDDGGSSGDSKKKYSSNAPKSICFPVPRTLMLKTSSSTDSSTSATQIVVEYNKVEDGGGCNSDFDRKFAF